MGWKRNDTTSGRGSHRYNEDSEMIKYSKLRDARIELGWSQDMLGSKIGFSGVYIGLIERGKRSPSVHVLERICGKLKIELGTIINNN